MENNLWHRNTRICNTPSPAEHLENRRYKTTLPAVTRPPYNSEEMMQSLFKRQEYAGHDDHAKWATTMPTPAASMATESTQCQPMAARWEHSQVIHGIHTRWCQILMKQVDVVAKSDMWWKVASAIKGSQCCIVSLIRSDLHTSGIDSPRSITPWALIKIKAA